MSRIVRSVTFTKKITLQKACYKKHKNDGVNSIVTPYLVVNNIDFVADVAKGVEAVAHDVDAKSLLGESEKATQDRDNEFEPVWKETLAWGQFLKKLFKNNTKQLTDWGFPIETSGIIKYPSPFAERVVISEAAITKNNSYPAGTSPLQTYITNNNNDITALSTNITNALAFDIDRKEFKKESVKAIQDRNKAFAQPYINLLGIGNYLMTLFPTTPKDVGLWGYDEVDTKLPEKVRTVTLQPLRKKVITSIVLGTELTNTGKKDLIVAAGKKGLGTPTTVAPGESIGMNKGCSSIVVTNPATIGGVTFTVSTR